MPDDPQKLNPLDQPLADFTDQMLNQTEAETPPSLSEDAELARLQKVILRLKQAGLADAAGPEAEPALSARLRATLRKEWQRSGSKPAQVGPGALQRIKDYLEQVFAGKHTWQIALAVAAVLLLVLFFLPQGSLPLTGAAGTDTDALRPLEFGLGILCAAVLIWLVLKKKG